MNDPAGMGYAGHVAAGDVRAIASLLNAAGAGSLALTSVSRDAFIDAFAGAIVGLLGRPESDPLRLKYAGALDALQLVDSIDLTNAELQATVASLIGDGIVTQAQVSALSSRPASRAELLFGAGAAVDAVTDVAAALRA